MYLDIGDVVLKWSGTSCAYVCLSINHSTRASGICDYKRDVHQQSNRKENT